MQMSTCMALLQETVFQVVSKSWEAFFKLKNERPKSQIQQLSQSNMLLTNTRVHVLKCKKGACLLSKNSFTHRISLKGAFNRSYEYTVHTKSRLPRLVVFVRTSTFYLK